ncbi:hypothetical protein V6347_15965 [Acinetobacter baumannii]|uniref:hypothetical protein n=1 Tax=Acinetobacter baumannii TaxID=470 RepID=UPI002147E14D|nr:hypothetical protein [Acinetobacter baumannii]MDC5139320.1 hypothetical protein [Acinetobacter baumannii]HAV3579272.1 hypothetical protein [Acinetobacter baumannii]
MQALLLIFGYFFVWCIYILALLLPYYVAYSIIEPHSFMGTVGVFILGSVIAPLIVMAAITVLGTIGLSFDALKNKFSKSNSYEKNLKTIYTEPERRKGKSLIYFLILIIFVCVGIIIYLLNSPKSYVEQPAYSETDSVYQDENKFNNPINNIDYQTESSASYTKDIDISSQEEQPKILEEELNESTSTNLSSPNLTTLGPSHLKLDIHFIDEKGISFNMDFKNANRPELNTSGTCTYTKNHLEGETRYSKLIDKELSIYALYECDNGRTIEVSKFNELDQDHLIMTLSLTNNSNRVFYSGEMVEP